MNLYLFLVLVSESVGASVHLVRKYMIGSGGDGSRKITATSGPIDLGDIAENNFRAMHSRYCYRLSEEPPVEGELQKTVYATKMQNYKKIFPRIVDLQREYEQSDFMWYFCRDVWPRLNQDMPEAEVDNLVQLLEPKLEELKKRKDFLWEALTVCRRPEMKRQHPEWTSDEIKSELEAEFRQDPSGKFVTAKHETAFQRWMLLAHRQELYKVIDDSFKCPEEIWRKLSDPTVTIEAIDQAIFRKRYPYTWRFRTPKTLN